MKKPNNEPETDRPRKPKRVFIHSEHSLARMRREEAAWNSGETMTQAEREYYRRGRL